MPVVRRAEDGRSRGTPRRGRARRRPWPSEARKRSTPLSLPPNGSTVDQVADDDHAATDEVRPERGSRGAREGDRLRADLSGNDDRGDADETGIANRNSAADTVQRQRLRVVVLVEDVVGVGLEALGAENAAEHAGQHEEDQRRADPQAADRRVPAGAENAGEATGRDGLVRWCCRGPARASGAASGRVSVIAMAGSGLYSCTLRRWKTQCLGPELHPPGIATGPNAAVDRRRWRRRAT